MQLTLDMVRNSLRKALGQDSFIATFIKSVTANPTCGTAAIDAEGNLEYAPQFLENYAHTRQALFCLIVHELMHRMFGHFIYQGGQLENVAADAVINACITHGFKSQSADGVLFKDFYKPTGIEGLLRPESQMSNSRYSALYWMLYKNGGNNGTKLSTGEVINALKVLTPQEHAERVVLLGGHGKSGDGEISPQPFPSQVLSDIAYDLRRAVKAGSGGNGAGHSDLIQELLIQILNSNISLKRSILEKFAAKQKLENFLSTTKSPRLSRSPIPLHPSKRELVLLSAGIYPFHYRRQSRMALT